MIIKKLSKELVSSLADAFKEWPKPRSLFEGYYNQQLKDERDTWVAVLDQKPVGYVTLKWQSGYRPFREKNIPEINDLNVLTAYRDQGIGSQLLQAAENAAFEKTNIVGLGVGLYADYGAAQRLYVRKGYTPDARGITYKNEFVEPGKQAIVDDELLLWLVKQKEHSSKQ